MEKVDHNNDPKQKYLLFGIFLFMFLLLLGFYSFKITSDKADIEAQNKEIDRLNNHVDLIMKKTAEKQQSHDQFSQESVQMALPLWDNTEQLLIDLNRISAAAGIQLRSVTFSTTESNQLQTYIGGAESPYATVHELKSALVLEGRYNDLVRWMGELQKLERLVVIDSFNLEKPLTASAMQNPILLNMNFTAYFDPSYRSLVENVLLPYGN